MGSDTSASGEDLEETQRPVKMSPITREAALRLTLEERFGRGTQIGRYLILKTLGFGGMGVVFLADDPELDRKVALKLLRPEPLLEEAPLASKLRLLREAQAIAKLSHPNVVAVFDVGSVPDGVFMAMEYVEGTSLRAWLHAESRTTDEILDVFLAAGRGVAAAHAKGMVHRDIKPDNILVGNDGRVRVLDFGLARTVHEQPDAAPNPDADLEHASEEDGLVSESITAAGAVLGTPKYMAPELFTTAPAGPKSDQFAFCVALFEALFGVRPFQKGAVARRKRNQPLDPAPVPAKGRRHPRALRAIVSRGLAMEPEQRHPSMSALLDQLLSIRSRRRRRALWSGAVALVGVGVTIGVAPGTNDGPCEAAADGMRRSWNTQTKASIRTAFSATRVGFSEQAHAQAIASLDDYARTWTDARTAACTATVVEGTQPGAVMDLRVGCLEQRRQHFDALVDTLSTADVAAVENAGQAVAQLPRPEFCNDPNVLADLPPIPSDPNTRAAVDEIRQALARIDSERFAGHYSEAWAQASELAARVDALGYAPASAEFHLARARVAAALSRRSVAEESLRTALGHATAARYERLRAEAWLDLANELGAMQKRFDAAEEAMWAASTSIDGLGHDADLDARLMLAQAGLAAVRDQDATAVSLYRTVLALETPAVRRHDVLHRIGTILEGPEAIAALEEALTLREDSLGLQHPKVADTLLSLAKERSLRRQPEPALEAASRAHQIYAETFGHQSGAVAKAESLRGYIEARRGDQEAAARHFEEAVRLMKAQPDVVEFDLASTVGNLGTIYSRLGRHAEARALHLESMDVYRRHDPDHPQIALPTLNIGATYLREENYEEAALWYERAVELLLAGPAHETRAADFEVDIADAHRLSGKFSDAHAVLRRAQARYERHVEADSPSLYRVWQVRAQVLHDQGLSADALEAAEHASELLEGHDEASVPAEAWGESAMVLARIRWDNGQPVAAREAAEHASAQFTAHARPESAQAAQAWLAAHPEPPPRAPLH